VLHRWRLTCQKFPRCRLFLPLRQELRRQITSWSAARIDVVPALLGDDSVLFGALALFLVLLDKAPMLGFPLLAPPFLFVLILLFGGRFGIGTALVAVVVGEGIYLTFVKWLGLLLPASAWF